MPTRPSRPSPPRSNAAEVKDPSTPFDDPKARFQAGLFGMWLFLIALGVLFVATILGYLVVRIDNGDAFIPEGAPRPPALLLASTAALLLSSVTMQKALRAGRVGDPRQGGLMLATLVLGGITLRIVRNASPPTAG